MRKFLHLGIFLLLFTLTSCELAGDIFEAGIWTGVVLVVGLIALVIWLFSRTKK
ncbi:MAG: phosphatidate cytidylyltransferase [Flavobacteriaceae bacterium]|nr:phosphatidate cytidylyltransferase [Flavobacteriaceae bacterium]